MSINFIRSKITMFMALALSLLIATGFADEAPCNAPYQIIVEVEPVDIGQRAWDEMPVLLELDFTADLFTSLKLTAPVDLDSIQVFALPGSAHTAAPQTPWFYARSEGELPSRFYDTSTPWDFPIPSTPLKPEDSFSTFPRAGYFANVATRRAPGRLVWNHRQYGNHPSRYVICFDQIAPGSQSQPPRQGFVGDGSPRRTPQASPFTGTLNSHPATDDWDGDGLTDIVFGSGFGYLQLFRNQGTKTVPKYVGGEYLFDATGRLIDVGYMSNPEIEDFDGDGINDLLVSHTGGKVLWYKNIGSNSQRKLIWKGYIQADGKDIVTPIKPNPEAPHYTTDYSPGVDAVDWDADGDTDLILGGYITGYLWYYENIGAQADGTANLTFRGPIEADGQPIDTSWGAKPCALDLDNDGDLDLVIGCYGKGIGGANVDMPYLLSYENIGTAAKPKFTRSEIKYHGAGPEAKQNLNVCAQPRPLDFNNDGLMDLVLGDFVSVQLAENVGTRHAPRFKVEMLEAPWGLEKFSAADTVIGQIAAQLIDYNNDGILDVVTVPMDSEEPTYISINRDGGTEGIFEPAQSVVPDDQKIHHPAPYGDAWNYTCLIDFDKDTNYDLLWTDHSGYAYFHRNLGDNQNRRFDTEGIKLMTVSGKPVKVGPEVVSVDEVEDFTKMQGSRAGIAADDFNSDGKNDIVMADVFGDVYYFINEGTNKKPVFAERVSVGNAGHRAKVMVCDMDADGRADLLCSPGKLLWFRNLGTGHDKLFGPEQKIELPKSMYHSPLLLAVDWNKDGDMDFLVQNPHYPWLCWLEASYIKHHYPAAKITRVQKVASR